MLKCNNINKHNTKEPYIWEYKGTNLISGQCPKCKNQINIKVNKVLVKNATD